MKDVKRNIDLAASNLFEQLYEKALHLDYDHNWASTHTFKAYRNAVVGRHAPYLEPGDMARSESPLGRRLLILGTELGNVVVYTPLLYTQEVLWADVSEAMEKFVCSDALENKQKNGSFSRTLKQPMLQLLMGSSRSVNIARRFNRAPAAIRNALLDKHNENYSNF